MSFTALAPFYRSLEWLFAGPLLHSGRVRFLTETSSCQHALLLGEGPGSFLLELLQTNPQVHLTCVEKSPGMVRKARQRLKAHGLSEARVEFLCEDCLDWSPPEATYDLIASHYFFDCFHAAQIEELVPKLARAAQPGAILLITDFHIPERGFARWRAWITVQLLYTFFHLVSDISAWSLFPPDSTLCVAGFRLEKKETFSSGLVQSSLWRKQDSPSADSHQEA